MLLIVQIHKLWTSTLYKDWQQKDNTESENSRRKRAYRVLVWRQDLFDHHAVTGEGAPVECVGPIRTEGAQAVGIYINTIQCGGVTVKYTQNTHTHTNTNTKTFIIACNFQGNWCTIGKTRIKPTRVFQTAFVVVWWFRHWEKTGEKLSRDEFTDVKHLKWYASEYLL